LSNKEQSYDKTKAYGPKIIFLKEIFDHLFEELPLSITEKKLNIYFPK